MTRRGRSRARAFALVIVAAGTAACGGDKGTAPTPCDTYNDGNLSGASLVGGYELVSLCEGVKPDRAGATGSLTLTADNFDATVTEGGQTQTFSGPYTISGSAITVTLLSGQLAGTFTFSHDTLYVSTLSTGTLLSVVFHKTS